MIVNGIAAIITGVKTNTLKNTINALHNEVKAEISNDLFTKILEELSKRIKNVTFEYNPYKEITILISILNTFISSNNAISKDIDLEPIKQIIYNKITDFDILPLDENPLSEIFELLSILINTSKENIMVDFFKEITKKILDRNLSDDDFYRSITHLSLIILNISPNLRQEIETDLDQIKKILSKKAPLSNDFTLIKCFLNLGFNYEDNFFDRFINNLYRGIELISFDDNKNFISKLEDCLNNSFKLDDSFLRKLQANVEKRILKAFESGRYFSERLAELFINLGGKFSNDFSNELANSIISDINDFQKKIENISAPAEKRNLYLHLNTDCLINLLYKLNTTLNDDVFNTVLENLFSVIFDPFFYTYDTSQIMDSLNNLMKNSQRKLSNENCSKCIATTLLHDDYLLDNNIKIIEYFYNLSKSINLKIKVNLIDKIVDFFSKYLQKTVCSNGQYILYLSQKLNIEQTDCYRIIDALTKLIEISNEKISDQSLEKIIQGSFERISKGRIELEKIQYKPRKVSYDARTKRHSHFNRTYVYHILKILSSLVEANSKINESSQNHSFIQDANNWQNLSKIIDIVKDLDDSEKNKMDSNIRYGYIKISYQFGYFINSILLKNHKKLRDARHYYHSNELQNLIDGLSLTIDRSPNSFETRFQILLHQSEALNDRGPSKRSIDDTLKYQSDIITNVPSYKAPSNKIILALKDIKILNFNEKVTFIHCSDDSVYISRNDKFEQSTLIKFETAHKLLPDYKQLLNFFLQNGDNSEKCFNTYLEIDNLCIKALKNLEESNEIIGNDGAIKEKINSILEKYTYTSNIIENFDLSTFKSVLSLMLSEIKDNIANTFDVLFAEIEHSVDIEAAKASTNSDVNTNLNNSSQKELRDKGISMEIGQ